MMKKPFNFTFAVGPTQISTPVKKDIEYAAQNNLLSISHRGKEFTEISKNTIDALRNLYNVPEDYHIFFTSSATECWEICARNLVEKEAYAFVAGHFSGAFSKCLTSWGKTCHINEVNWGEINNLNEAEIPKSAELITLCHNETSTGVCLTMPQIEALQKRYPGKLIAVDVTSSIGACHLNIELADVWYFSVQKGFGLPSGLGVIFVGPRAMEKSKQLLDEKHPQGFFNFANMEKQMANGKFQTIPTPNILGIYLLGEQCNRFIKSGFEHTVKHIEDRANDLYTFFNNHPQTKPFVTNKNARSPYSLCIYVGSENLEYYKKVAAQKGVQLGGGYGPLKEDHMRVANYPAIADADIETLKEIFNS